MHVTTLGPLALDGTPVRGERLAAVVRELVAARGRAVSVSALVDAVWDGDPPEDATGAVQALVSRVRRLGLDVRAVPGGYRVASQDLRVDADEARALVASARGSLGRGDLVAAADEAARARALLPAVPEDPAATHLLADAADVTARAALASGGPYDETDLRLLAERTPPDEPSVALLVRVLAAQGRDAEAVEVVERLRRELAERYGTDPSPVVAQAHLALLRGELGPTGAPPRAGLPPALSTADHPPAGHPPAGHPPAGHPPVVHLPAAWRRPAGALVGRERDVQAVTAALRAAPVVTVVATGGAGKTRLAAEVARRAAERGDQVHVVELAALRAGDDVLPAVLGELGGAESVPTTGDLRADRRAIPRADRLRLAAQELTGLVVLDNCEHVLADAARVVAELLDVVGPDVTVLTTSRAPLGLVGEQVHRLSALPDEEALALLHARATAARADLVWDRDAAVELCHRLDNLPLALELAAARLRSMPVADVVAGLADRFALLDDALRGLPERHASLWAMVDWSRELLPAGQRDLLERLAVAPASFTVPLAARIGGISDAQARRDVADLVDQSLLTLDDAGPGPARYRMLETVREYGEARLTASGSRDAAVEGLVAWSARESTDLADRLTGHDQLAALARCGEEQETFVAALRWALRRDDEASAVEVASALFHWWTMRGLHVEVVTWAERLLRVADPAARRRSVLLTGPAPGSRLPDGDVTVSVMVECTVNSGVTSSLRLAALAGRVLRRVMREQRAQVGPRMTALADALPSLSSPTPDALENAAAALVAHADTYVRGLGLFLRAAWRENGGDTLSSAQDAREAFALFERVGDHWGMGMAAQGVAQWSATAAAPDAVAWLERGIEHLELVGAAQDARRLRVLLDVQRAVDGERDGLAALREVVDSPQADVADRAQALVGLALVALHTGDDDEARRLALRAAEVVAQDASPVPQGRVVIRVAAAVVVLQAGGPGIAEAAAILAATTADVLELPDMPVVGSYALGGAELAARRGDDETALELWALGTRLGANLATVSFTLGRARSLAGESVGERGERRVAELRDRPATEVARMIVERMASVLA
ncbi:transcriptional regulator [Cellulomonas sp. DKR-3]|uniref:Transcriptional regulator n=1 Tax=Cellulomonas fulva TaxID=2835530 RepID=A0ABS5TXF1_9CELL|nr:AAA family ATPase [Cellulomonas fulva]MBT0993827.1 transcriptional regulator [Cellulomonas fulva]